MEDIDVKKEVSEELNSLRKMKDNELIRTARSLRRIYRRIRKIMAKKISNPLVKSMLKIAEKWFRFWAKRLAHKARELRSRKSRIDQAAAEFKKGKPELAKKL